MDLIRIADDSLGYGALESMWRAIEEDVPNVSFYVILRVIEGEPIGFALFHYERLRSKRFSYTVGVVDTICVAEAYRGSGFGSFLTFNVLKRMSAHGVNRVELVMKEPSTETASLQDVTPGKLMVGSERFLYDLGFKKVQYLPKYWAADSEDRNYDCALCHGIPDTCTGVLFAVNEV